MEAATMFRGLRKLNLDVHLDTRTVWSASPNSVNNLFNRMYIQFGLEEYLKPAPGISEMQI